MGNLKHKSMYLPLVALLGVLVSSVEAAPPRIFAMSSSWEAGSQAVINLNDRVLPRVMNTGGHARGITLVVIDLTTQTVLHHACYDTYGSSSESQRLVSALTNHAKRHKNVAYVLATADEATHRLSTSQRASIKSVTRCDKIMKLGFRDALACISLPGKTPK